MNHLTAIDKFFWYAVYTKAMQEERAASNLRAWGVKTFMPKIRERRPHRGYGRQTTVVKHLFPRYIFAQFDSDSVLHKVKYTRGVCDVVGFGEKPCPVGDLIIESIQSQMGEAGFIKFEEEFHNGDKVMIQSGSFTNLCGTVDGELSDSNRLTLLLSSVSFQGRLMIEKALVMKVPLNH
jgi:transcription elongation factor/antiterminator RfaH